MKNSLLLLITVFNISLKLSAQEVVSSTFLLSYPLEHFTQDLEIPFARFGVDMYRIAYTTRDIEGKVDTATGLLCIPQVEGKHMPVVSYSHGTVGNRFEVPSYLSAEHNIPSIYSAMGTLCIAADYLGLGDSRGLHPYVHADSEAWASYDMLVAVQSFLPQEMGVYLNDQLYITGYSQGGHSAMALHRYIETETDLEVTASIPMSGPYSISEGMLDLLVSDEAYGNVAYVASTALSYQLVYGNIFPENDIHQFFKPPYADIILKYANEEEDLFVINEELIDSLVAIEGKALPKKMIFDDLVAEILSDDNHPVNVALRDNDVYDWAPKSETRLIYCMADDQVAFQNSIIARDKMHENGATHVLATDLNPNFNHTECVTPAVTLMVFYLLNFSSLTSSQEIAAYDLNVYPNPSFGSIILDYTDNGKDVNLEVYNTRGQQEFAIRGIQSHESLSLDLKPSLYLLILKDSDGKYLASKKLIIQ